MGVWNSYVDYDGLRGRDGFVRDTGVDALHWVALSELVECLCKGIIQYCVVKRMHPRMD
ncbi:hypothetical protein EVJ58_g771 [Rhodofomes roseus]|uniref:Uncharacterized protein n=1 Tax=Rhodofomes roseus TaxID=34475 RepID=A0A4Y9Z1X6_9APHY|nr:hypothetical protein EVJ58_g771 [Rhodofomes roseus]